MRRIRRGDIRRGFRRRRRRWLRNFARRPFRSLAARYEKARRGELVVAAPVGFIKVGDRLEKDPDRRVQAAIQLAIEKVAELGSVRQALL